MSGPYHMSDMFHDFPGGVTLRCPDPENCEEMHMEHEMDAEGIPHHYGCDCGYCQYEYWVMKN